MASTPPPQHARFPVPEQIPGYRIEDYDQLAFLRETLSGLCAQRTVRFPGSQPVSFDRQSLELLEQEDFWVCEKSDGVRVLVLIMSSLSGAHDIYLVDRKEEFYLNNGVYFPHQEGLDSVHSSTVLDGELVIEVDPSTHQERLTLLLFDLLVCDEENLMHKPLSSRYGRLKEWIIKPYEALLQTLPTEQRQAAPFDVVLKRQELAYGIEAVFKDHLPRLKHGNDGLIFTSAEAPYTPGTDQKILKWKPPSENSIDFLLQLKFPALDGRPSEPDLSAKPVFMLMMNHGHEGTHYFDTMEVDDETWERWKESREQYDDRVVEVVWDKHRQTWKMLRFRDDKHEGNFKTVVSSIIKSIEHGVEADELISHAAAIKMAWRRRASERDAERQRSMAAAAKKPPLPRPSGLASGQGLKR